MIWQNLSFSRHEVRARAMTGLCWTSGTWVLKGTGGLVGACSGAALCVARVYGELGYNYDEQC